MQISIEEERNNDRCQRIGLPHAGRVEVLVDNQCAVENITRFASNQGYAVAVAEGGDEEFTLTLTK